jgi:hypothetical protein
MFLINLIPDSVLFGFVWMTIVCGIAMYFASMFPFISNYKAILRPLGVVLMVAGVYFYGSYDTEMKWRAKAAELQAEIDRKNEVSAQVTTEIVTKYIDKVKVVKEKGDVIIKEIPKYITKESDANCTISKSFILLHNSAAKNEVPDAATGVDETSSGVKLSDVASTVTLNYNNYHQLSEQIKALQDWVAQQEKIYNGK